MPTRNGSNSGQKGSYGIDAPRLLPIPVVLIAGNIAYGVFSGSVWPFVGALVILVSAGCGLYTSRRGKFVVWAGLLDQLALRGDERILDMGCGRGAVLMMAARYLITGRAVGVDRWKKEDQSGNAAEATQRNAAAEGVAGRIDLYTADMTALPFEDNSFDVVLSSIAIHNIKGRTGRDKAIEQAVRVLRPGGKLMIADILTTHQYHAQLTRRGMVGIARRDLGWRMWWGGPWVRTRLVTATKTVAPVSATQPDR
ncbi:MAG: class I SAM-dependent methyltransferase [Terriglobia bacterium]